VISWWEYYGTACKARNCTDYTRPFTSASCTFADGRDDAVDADGKRMRQLASELMVEPLCFRNSGPGPKLIVVLTPNYSACSR
jgi:hypothetical protein